MLKDLKEKLSNSRNFYKNPLSLCFRVDEIQEYFGVNSYKEYKGNCIKEPLENCLSPIYEALDSGIEYLLETIRSKFLRFFEGSVLEVKAYELYTSIFKGENEVDKNLRTMEFLHRVIKIPQLSLS